MNICFEKMKELDTILTNNNVPHDFYEWDTNGYKIDFDWSLGDIVCNKYTFFECESYNCPWDRDDVTRCSSKEMGKKITKWYYNLKRERIH